MFALIDSFPGGASGKEPACHCRRCKRRGFDPWVEKMPLEEEIAKHFSIFFFSLSFLLKDNCFTEFCCFLPNLSMNQP